jgi:hypothetical protein
VDVDVGDVDDEYEKWRGRNCGPSWIKILE